MTKNFTIKRALVTLSSKDNEKFQRMQVQYFGKTTNIEVLFPYGLNANPPEGSLALLIPINNDDSNMTAFIYDPTTRFKDLKQGEVAIGNPTTKARIEFSEDGSINIIKNETTSIKINEDGSVDINSTQINLGTGGPAIARLGDTVTGQVIIPTGSSAGTFPVTSGVISSGSTQNTSA